jgi:hypothetical protein
MRSKFERSLDLVTLYFTLPLFVIVIVVTAINATECGTPTQPPPPIYKHRN